MGQSRPLFGVIVRDSLSGLGAMAAPAGRQQVQVLAKTQTLKMGDVNNPTRNPVSM